MEKQEKEAIENDPILKKLRQSKTKRAAKFLLNVSSCLLNPDLLVSQAFCIFLYGSCGAITPYLPLYFKQYGLVPYQVGIILGLAPIVQCLVSPIWSVLAGKWHAQKLVFLSGVLSFLVKLLLILAVQPRKQYCLQSYLNSTSNLTYTQSMALADVMKGLNSKWKAKPTVAKKILKTTVAARTVQRDVSEDRTKDDLEGIALNYEKQDLEGLEEVGTMSHTGRHLMAEPILKSFLPATVVFKRASRWDPSLNKTVIYRITSDKVEVYDIFLIFVLFVLVCDFLQAPTFGLGDGSIFNRLQDNFRTGPVKMHLVGYMGWVASALIVGAIVSGSKSLICGSYRVSYNIAFYFSIGFVCMAFIHALWFEYVYDQSKDIATDTWKKSLQTFCKAKNFAFALCLLYISLCTGFLVPFLNWYIDDLGGSTLVVATVCVTRVVTVFIFYQFGKTMVSILGKTNVILFSLMSYAVCFFCYWLVKETWVIVAIVAIEGASFGLLWRCCDRFIAQLRASSNVVTLTKGLLEALFWGAGQGLGAIIGGALYGWLGKATFCTLGVSTVIMLIFLATIVYYKNEAEEEEDLDSTEKQEVLNDTDHDHDDDDDEMDERIMEMDEIRKESDGDGEDNNSGETDETKNEKHEVLHDTDHGDDDDDEMDETKK